MFFVNCFCFSVFIVYVFVFALHAVCAVCTCMCDLRKVFSFVLEVEVQHEINLLVNESTQQQSTLQCTQANMHNRGQAEQIAGNKNAEQLKGESERTTAMTVSSDEINQIKSNEHKHREQSAHERRDQRMNNNNKMTNNNKTTDQQATTKPSTHKRQFNKLRRQTTNCC